MSNDMIYGILIGICITFVIVVIVAAFVSNMDKEGW